MPPTSRKPPISNILIEKIPPRDVEEFAFELVPDPVTLTTKRNVLIRKQHLPLRFFTTAALRDCASRLLLRPSAS